ncbi:MAG: YegS/Rv2252/BmrU family lipid kinase [Clostridia bacterium]|nr:YegS/Rv2252/BmrU family lipid kinase [Clostridia bacterium]
MRHIFIVNPDSGPQDATASIRRQIAAANAENFAEIHVTRATGDATQYVSKLCSETTEELRFYACGGDGTLNEVVNGAAGHPHAAVGCWPCGSGNDFVKYYGGKQAFLNLPAQLSAAVTPIDLIRVNERYAVNVVNIGFEAKAAARMVSFRRIPLFQGPRSYYPAVVTTLIDGLKNPFRIALDGEKIFDGNILLCTFANGGYVGGSFHCAPRADMADGLLEICMVTPVSRLRFAKLIGFYQRGEHLDNPAMKDCVTYRRARKAEIESDREFLICLDGEILKGTRFTIQSILGALRLILPSGAAHTEG